MQFSFIFHCKFFKSDFKLIYYFFSNLFFLFIFINNFIKLSFKKNLENKKKKNLERKKIYFYYIF
jgi:hypothetical protein